MKAYERVRCYLDSFNEEEAERREAALGELMDSLEPHAPKGKGGNFPRFIRTVMDEVESGNEKHVKDAMDRIEKGRAQTLLQALDEIRTDHHRNEVRRRYPDQEWVESIQKGDIKAIHAILKALETHSIPAGIIADYVSRHP